MRSNEGQPRRRTPAPAPRGGRGGSYVTGQTAVPGGTSTHYPTPAPPASYPSAPAPAPAPAAPHPTAVAAAHAVTNPLASTVPPEARALGAYAIEAAKLYGISNPLTLLGLSGAAKPQARSSSGPTLRDVSRGHGVMGPVTESAAVLAKSEGSKPPQPPSLPPGAHLQYLSEISVLGKQGATKGPVAAGAANFLDPTIAQRAKQYAAQGQGPAQQIPVAQTKKAPRTLADLSRIGQQAHPAPKQLPAGVAKRAAVLFPGFTQQGAKGLPVGKAQNVAQVQHQQASRQVKHAIAHTLKRAGVAGDPRAAAVVASAIKYGRQYGVSPALLVAISKVESGVGTSTLPGVQSGQNSAGAAGPMQMGNGTGAAGNAWQTYSQQIWGAKAAQHSVYNIPDAMHAAAVYLKTAGAPASINNTAAANTAALAYNHVQWYADEVLTYARQFAALDQAGGSVGGLGGGGGTQSVSLKDKNSPFVFIAPKGTPLGRTDMGVDFSYDGPVRALGDGHVVRNNYNGFPGYGASNQGIILSLDHPVQGAKHYYIYENGFFPNTSLKAGDRVTKGQVIGRSTTTSSTPTGGSGSSFEVGFGDVNGRPLAAATYTEGAVTHWGSVMADLLSGKRVTTATGGATAGIVSAAASTGAVPLGSSGAVAQALTGAPASVRNSFAKSQHKARMQAQAEQNRARGYITPPSGLAAQSPLPFGFGGNFQTGSQASGSGGAFRPTRRLSATR